MRWIKSNGKRLIVREVGPVQYELESIGRVPLPIIDEVLDDDTARARLRAVLQVDHAGSYERVPHDTAPALTGAPILVDGPVPVAKATKLKRRKKHDQT
jgi:hypothetical protein